MMRQKASRSVLVIAAAVSLLILIGCGTRDKSSSSGGPITINIFQPYETEDPVDFSDFGLGGGNNLRGAAGASAEVSSDDAGTAADLINIQRCEAGLTPVSVNAKLNEAAAFHALNMAQRDFLDHQDTVDNTSPDQRVSAAGYHATTVGELIAGGGSTFGDVFASWWNSADTHSTLLGADYREIGLGHAQTSGATYSDSWVLVLAAPDEAAGESAAAAVSCE